MDRVRAAFSSSIVVVETWCAGRHWPLRLLFLAWLAWVAGNHLVDDQYWSLFGSINLGIHEGGHVLFRPLGEWFTVAGGTIAQCAAPLIAGALFVRQEDYFGSAVCGVWLADNLYGVAAYCADASSRALPLVNIGGGDAEHDWTYLMESIGMLGSEGTFAALIRLIAFALGWGSIVAGAWMCWRMAGTRPVAPPRR